MAKIKWICKNVDNCDKAFNNDGKSFEDLIGHDVASQFEPYKCEDCGKDLEKVKEPSSEIDGKKIAIIAALVVVLGGAGFGVWKIITRPPETVTSVTVTDGTPSRCPVSSHAAAPEMIFVEGGSGISSFCIGKYEITQAQWVEVMGGNPSGFTGDNRRPVDNVSWNDAQGFINRLNTLTGNKYRLPTEAEWEYAARGGAQSRGYTYSGSNNAGDVAWFGVNTTQPVGTKQPNELGIYDMSGNVWEWCSDQRGSDRALRGGGWNSNRTVTYQGGNYPDRRYNYNGFRVVHSLVESNKSAF